MNSELRPSGSRRGFFAVFCLALTSLCLVAIWGTGSHIGNRNIRVKSPATRLAEALVELDVDPEITDAELETVVEQVRMRAVDGDLDAAAFVAQLAAMQRAPSSNGDASAKLTSAEE